MRNRKILLLLILMLSFISFTSAISWSGGSSGSNSSANVTSVSSSDSYISASPTTGDVILSLNSLATKWFYNQTTPALFLSNSSLSNLLNGTYALIGASSGNASWNQSYANTLYQPIGIAYNSSYESTFNATYALWAHNQSNLTWAFNQSNIQFNFNQSNILYNYNETDQRINYTFIQNISSYDCSGTNKVVGIADNGTIVCGADQTGTGGGNPFNQDLNTTNNVQFQNGTFFKLGVNKVNSGTIGIDIRTGTNLTQGLRIETNGSTNLSFSTFVNGDAQVSFRFNGVGNQSWGNGSSAVDTTIGRSGVATLQLTDNLNVNKNLSVGNNLTVGQQVYINGVSVGDKLITNSSLSLMLNNSYLLATNGSYSTLWNSTYLNKNVFNQQLNTTSNVTFYNLNLTSTNGDNYLTINSPTNNYSGISLQNFTTIVHRFQYTDNSRLYSEISGNSPFAFGLSRTFNGTQHNFYGNIVITSTGGSTNRLGVSVNEPTRTLDVGGSGLIGNLSVTGNVTAQNITIIGSIRPIVSTTCVEGSIGYNNTNFMVCNSTGRWRKVLLTA